MPRQGNGSYQQPANTAAVSGQSIASTAFNTLVTDLGSELTLSLDRNGRSAMAAALPMGGNKITGTADPTAAQDVATKNYIDTITALLFSTGDIKLTLKTVADSGWVLFNDGTIGNDTSGASLASTATAQALFYLLWDNILNTSCPIQDSTGALTTRGASHTADFAASKRMPLPKALGRALAISGAGAGLTSRSPGQNLGEENHLLTIAEMPSHNHGGATGSHAHSLSLILVGGTLANITAGAGNTVGSVVSNGFATDAASATISAQGGGTAHNVMQPTTFLNAMIKL